MPSREEIFADFWGRFDDPESRKYLHTHRRRYETLLDRVDRAIAAARSGPARVLDVGPAYQTEAIRRLHPEVVVDTLGFHDPRFPLRERDRHVDFDLNDADDPARRPRCEPYDVIVVAEVIEHLHASPLHALRLLRSLLARDGTLLLQTPNAAALDKRLDLLLGRNPYEQIREDRRNAGHFREYTVDELVRLAEQADFVVADRALENYFFTGSRKNRVFVALGAVVPPSLRDGITLELRVR